MNRRLVLFLVGAAATAPAPVIAQQTVSPTSSIINVPGASTRSANVCRATGDPCFLGIDPDRYAMPLIGEYIQRDAGLLCAMTSWTTLPPQMFDLAFMRTFWQVLSPVEQAQVEAAAFHFVTTHWGPPGAPPDDLWAVATPKDFEGEIFSALETRTTRIEFEVPKSDIEILGWQATHISAAIVPDAAPNIPLKLRGWYIKADGRDSGPPQAQAARAQKHPLIIISTGFPYSMAADYLVGGINPGEQTRKTITYLVANGFDVLIFDKRGHGYSEGVLDGMGADVFRVLDQLEHGVISERGIELTLSIITPDGQFHSGAAAAAEQLLGAGYTAKTKPVVLRGFSYGSSQLQKAMALNYSSLPVEFHFTRDAAGHVIVDPTRPVIGNRGYNFRGIVAISGFQGSVKYETVPYFLALDALASTIGHSGATLKSTVYESMSQWPGFLGLYGTTDFETADGAIDAYNKLRGVKEIRMVTSYHFGLSSREIDTYFAAETEEFATSVVNRNPSPRPNESTTTYAQEVCAAEEVVMDPTTQSITGVPSKVIQDANRKVDAFLDRWLKSR